MRAALALASVLAAFLLALTGCESQKASAETAAREPTLGSVQLGESRYPFTITACLRSGRASSDDFEILGVGTTPDGRLFDVHADAARVEVRIKGQNSGAIAIYTSAFEPGSLALRENLVSAEGPFLRIAQGGRLEGRFQASCPAPRA